VYFTPSGNSIYQEYVDTILVVCLSRISTHLIVFEGDCIAKMYIGNGSDYESVMQEKFGKDLTPQRVKYRTLKR
jgi:hypothetical protein